MTAPIYHVDTATYDSQLKAKVERVKKQFTDHFSGEIDVFESKKKHYRQRCEFRIWKDYDEEKQSPKDMYYVMFEGQEKRTAEKVRHRVDDFHVGSELVNELMHKVLAGVKGSEVLSRRIFQANFHTTLSGQAMVTLLYHRKLDDEWKAEAEKLRQSLARIEGVEEGHTPSVIGRSRKQKLILGTDYVVETLRINGVDLKYQQLEGGFSQPNAGMSVHMLEWACEHGTKGTKESDLLELYCGNGNFSIGMADKFRRCVGTEISKPSVAAAQYNIQVNKTENVHIARCRSEEFSAAMLSGEKFKRQDQLGVDLDECDFKTVLVDPPRAGLDDDTVKLVSNFDRIIYISCNPDTLFKNVEAFSDTHQISRFALFDQFPYSHHVECGLVLDKKPETTEKKRKLN
jgi:tRNA (uracil-5-)-methyltransferase